MSGERIVEFIENFISGKYTNHLIIMDNAGAHKNKSVQSATFIINLLNLKISYSIAFLIDRKQMQLRLGLVNLNTILLIVKVIQCRMNNKKCG